MELALIAADEGVAENATEELETAALAENLGGGTKTGIEEKTDADGTGDGPTSGMLEDENRAELDTAIEDELAEREGEVEGEKLAKGTEVATALLEGAVAATKDTATGDEDIGKAVGVTVLVLHEVVATPLLMLILSISTEPKTYIEVDCKQ